MTDNLEFLLKKIGLYPAMKPDEKPPEPSRELLILIDRIKEITMIHMFIDEIKRQERRRREEPERLGKEPKDKGYPPPRPDDSGIWIIKKGKRRQIT